MNGAFDVSPRAQARIAGVIYIAAGVTSMIGEMFVRGRLIVPGNPAATAANILSHESLWRAGGVADLVAAAGGEPQLRLRGLASPAGRDRSVR